jgi:hypothetical protein
VEELYLSSAQPGRPKIRYLFSSGRAYPSTHICTPPPSLISPPTRQCPTQPCPLARVDSRRLHPRPVLLRPSQGGAHRPCASQRPAPLALPCGLSTHAAGCSYSLAPPRPIHVTDRRQQQGTRRRPPVLHPSQGHHRSTSYKL